MILAEREIITEVDLPRNLKHTFPCAEEAIFSLEDIESSTILEAFHGVKKKAYDVAKGFGLFRDTLYGKPRKQRIKSSGRDSFFCLK